MFHDIAEAMIQANMEDFRDSVYLMIGLHVDTSREVEPPITSDGEDDGNVPDVPLRFPLPLIMVSHHTWVMKTFLWMPLSVPRLARDNLGTRKRCRD